MKPCDFHYCWSAVGEMLNWQKQTFFSRGGHHKGVMLRAPKWLAAAQLLYDAPPLPGKKL